MAKIKDKVKPYKTKVLPVKEKTEPKMVAPKPKQQIIVDEVKQV